ncbi:MAG: hypothetical protein WBD16_11425 [Pyrinomonadaceae bacterium]
MTKDGSNSLPLSAKGRIEVYLPDLLEPAYQSLLLALENEFTYNFGGCTIVRGLDGNYLSKSGVKIHDRITIIYTDSPYSFQEHLPVLSSYIDWLRDAAFEALNEETILVTAFQIFHAT